MRSLSLPPVLLVCFLWSVGALPQVLGQAQLSGRANRQLQERVEFDEAFAGSHVGFSLYDLETGTYLYGYQADRHFVPASNVKLLTFFLTHRLLGHRAPALFYQEYQDRLEVWGTGYPLLLHPAFAGFDELGPWLSARGTKPLILHRPPAGAGAVERYGAGWSWDDYNDAYVYERSAFSLFGNRLYLDVTPVDTAGRQALFGSPPGIAGALRQDDAQAARLRRSEFDNDFTLGRDYYRPDGFPLERPLHLSSRLLVNELTAAYPNLEVRLGTAPYPADSARSVLTASLPDTVFRRLLIDSDNFLAEQLLLQAAARRYGAPDTRRILRFATDTLLPTIGIEDIRWADGSGLSRYNLLTPRHFTRLVTALAAEVGRERLLSLLPLGGVRGTLKTRFTNRPEPYVWAKTGSLSGVMSVSGLLRTKQGRWLVFSFLHNNYVGSSRPLYRAMEETLGWCYDEL